MPITDKTRKILWARSGNRCAICRIELVVEPTLQDSESVVGEECHIVSSSPNGPRHDPKFLTDAFDAVDNLILFCANHHKMIDDQQETYTAELVRSIKQNHETWVQSKLSDKYDPLHTSVRRSKDDRPTHLSRINSATDLVEMITKTSAHGFQHDDDLSSEEVEVVGGFLQEVSDWIDIHDDLEPLDRVRTSKRFKDMLVDLEGRGFLVFAAKESAQLEGGVGPPEAFPILHLSVLRASNPLVRRDPPPSK